MNDLIRSMLKKILILQDITKNGQSYDSNSEKVINVSKYSLPIVF